MNLEAIRAVANAILYEGYMLYPYRPSALKNRSQGWTFGTLLPERYAAAHAGENSAFAAELIVIGAAPRVTAEFRFLHLRDRDAIERSVTLNDIPVAELLSSPQSREFSFSESDDVSGCIPTAGVARLSAARVCGNAFKVRLSLVNQSSPATSWETRDAALRQALVSAHALLVVSAGEFVSLLNAPAEFADAAASCRQSGVFPVLAGDEGERNAMLVSPIILYDYPQIAAKSHGDLFDSSEIDEILTLRVLTLTDAEKEEVRAAGDRARALLQRTESLSAEDILNLHGDLRGMSETRTLARAAKVGRQPMGEDS